MGDLENKLSRVKELSIPDLKNLCDNIRVFIQLYKLVVILEQI